jgi:hypothetical protein
MHANDFHRRAGSMLLALVATMLLMAAPTFAAEPAGRVLTTKGTVTAIDRDDFDRPLSRNDVVYPGETLRTGENGRIQVRFRDDALVDLKPDTEFEIERYQEASEESGGSAVMNLLKGALRTITGAIGNNEDDEYAVDTPVATIGIRGTDYSLEFCDATCAGDRRPPGLYGRVDDGSIIAQTGAGSNPFSTGDYFFIPEGGTPQRIIAPPEGVLLDEDSQEDGGESATQDPLTGGSTADGNGPAETTTLEHSSDLLDPEYEAGDDQVGISPNLEDALAGVAFSGQASGAVRHDANVFGPQDDSVDAWVDEEGNLLRIVNDENGFNSSTAALTDEGEITGPGFVANWGRWEGDFVIDNDTELSGEAVYAYTKDWTSAADLDGIDSRDYNLSLGPDSAQLTNEAWNLDALNFSADFTNSTISLTFMDLSGPDNATIQFETALAYDIDGASFSGALVNGNFSNSISSGSVEGGISGAFIGQTADGALVAFTIEDSGDIGDEFDSLDGVAILGPLPN